MIQTYLGMMAGQVLVLCLVGMLAVLAMRLADENKIQPRNHLVIIGGAMMAFGIVYRITDVLAHIDTPRWSSVAGAIGILAFLLADQQVAARHCRIMRQHLARGHRIYTGPERRAPNTGQRPAR